jgi:Transglutaminase-like superfamily
MELESHWNHAVKKQGIDRQAKDAQVKGKSMVMQLGTLRHLPRRDRQLVFKTLWLLWRVQLGLWLNPALALEAYHRVVVNRSSNQRAPIYQLLWAIQTASPFLPKVTTLTEALAAKTLLARYGYDSKLHVGVVKAGENVQAHAWLTQGGDVVLGELEDLSLYRPLSSIRGQRNKLVWRSAR